MNVFFFFSLKYADLSIYVFMSFFFFASFLLIHYDSSASMLLIYMNRVVYDSISLKFGQVLFHPDSPLFEMFLNTV